MDYVYELADVTCEDMYHSLGVFSDVSKVVAAISEKDGLDGRPMNDNCEDMGDERLEVRCRELDRSDDDLGDVVARYLRMWRWSDDEEHVIWETWEVDASWAIDVQSIPFHHEGKPK